MESTTGLASRSAGSRFTPGSVARGALGAAIATAVVLVAIVAIGVLFWETVAGFQRVCICGELGVTAGAALDRPESMAARNIGGGTGGVVAGYFALAAGEVLPPGTMQWALGEGLYAALFAPTNGGPRGEPHRIAQRRAASGGS